jgi:hypothetical protein
MEVPADDKPLCILIFVASEGDQHAIVWGESEGLDRDFEFAGESLNPVYPRALHFSGWPQ